jgi:hypothetical protein
MPFIRGKLAIEDIVKQADYEARLKLLDTSGIVGGGRVLKSVEKSEPHRHGDYDKQNTDEEGLEEFCSFADNRTTE